MKLPPGPAAGAHHIEDVLAALERAGIVITPYGADAYLLMMEDDDRGPLVQFFPTKVGDKIIQQLMGFFGADENSFLPHLIGLTKKRNANLH